MRIAVVVLLGSHIYGLGLKGARVPTSDKKDALAAAYRTINEADAETAKQVDRLRKLHKQTGESEERSALAISEILEGGAGAADRLKATADAVAQLHGLKEEED